MVYGTVWKLTMFGLGAAPPSELPEDDPDADPELPEPVAAEPELLAPELLPPVAGRFGDPPDELPLPVLTLPPEPLPEVAG